EWGVLQGLPRGVKGGLEGLGRTLIHPIDTAEALLAVPRLISSGLLKCLLEQKWNEFAAGSWEERGMMVGEVIGNFAIGIIADKGIGELFQILRAGSKLSAAGKIANAAAEVAELPFPGPAHAPVTGKGSSATSSAAFAIFPAALSFEPAL